MGISKPTSLFLITFLLFSACTKDSTDGKKPRFYHWKTFLDISEKKQEYLKLLQVKKIYVRFFDVKWVEQNKKAYPFATIQVKNGIDTSIQIVPTVYITNKTLINITESAIPDLAKEIMHKIYRLCSSDFYKHTNSEIFSEIQFDCDWTISTKEKYFTLIQESRKNEYFSKLNLSRISSTIRLHQVKYFEKTGIPPVDRAMLMFYNVGKVSDKNTENSILDLEIVKKYLTNFDDYPLGYDIALPLFSWGVVFRDGHIVKLINNLSTKTLKEHSKFKHIEKNRFKASENNYINKSFLYKGDEIRVEEVNQEKLIELVKLISDAANNNNFNICFYHLDEKIIDNYDSDKILELISVHP